MGGHYDEILMKLDESVITNEDPDPWSERGKLAASQMQINVDIPRTFAGHPLVMRPEAQELLRRVLYAYALHNTELGYCQGMNLIAAMLLVVCEAQYNKDGNEQALEGEDNVCAAHRDEEAMFWMLVVMLERVFPGYHGDSLENVRLDRMMAFNLLRGHDPALYDHLMGYQILDVVIPRWYVSIFTDVL